MSIFVLMRSLRPVLPPDCAPVLAGGLKRSDAEQLAATFKAIADPARLLVLSFIAAQPSGEACVCHFTGPLGLSQPTVSHHLKILYEAGLLEKERRGTWIYYRIIPGQLAALRKALESRGAPRNEKPAQARRRA
jgi:ArsR family transcriptional regulator